MNELLLWACLALLIALLALAVFAGRRGLRSLGVVGNNAENRDVMAKLDSLTTELSKLNQNLEALVSRDQKERRQENTDER
ncbi:MAG: hypothetical protein AAGH60_11405 [Pseudomonadota bacterium]